MSILMGNDGTEPAQVWYGNNELKEIWVGGNKVWPSGPQADAKFWFDFNDGSALLKNRGTTKPNVVVQGIMSHDQDHIIFNPAGRLSTLPTTNWLNGFTVSMWTRDTPPNSGWKTIMHRAVASGTLTNEAYIVHNTSATTITTVSGLKFGSTHKEYSANYSLPVTANWFHTVVVWRRTSTTAFSCTFYVNGVQRGSFAATGYASNTSFSAEQLYIGGNRTGGEWSGRMDDLLVWDRALLASEVTALYTQGRSWIPTILTNGPFAFVIGDSGQMDFIADFSVTSWSATGLPNGLTMTTSGVLSGAATTSGSGTMIVTASGGGRTATKSFQWQVTAVPNLPIHAIKATGQTKMNTSGWGRVPLPWQLVTAGSGEFTSGGNLTVPRGRGRIRVNATMTNGRNSRLVSDQRGVLVTGSGTSHDYRTEIMVFNQGENLFLEVENYVSTTNDSFLLSTEQP